jgi:hypothetical protein
MMVRPKRLILLTKTRLSEFRQQCGAPAPEVVT